MNNEWTTHSFFVICLKARQLLFSVLNNNLFVVRNQKRHLHLTGVGTGANKDGLLISD